MDEATWLNKTEARSLLSFLKDCGFPVSARKLRWFACACVRKRWHNLTHAASREAIEFLERMLDVPGWGDNPDDPEWRAVAEAARGVLVGLPSGTPALNKIHNAAAAAAHACNNNLDVLTDVLFVCTATAASAADEAVDDDDLQGDDSFSEYRWFTKIDRVTTSADHDQADLLRDIVGNPYRPITLNPDWLTYKDGMIVSRARSIYRKRTFHRMHVLGRLLEKAGCTNAVILDHCRELQTHARGCWLLDAILCLP